MILPNTSMATQKPGLMIQNIRNDPLNKGSYMTFTLTPPTSFNLSAVIRSHGWIQMPPFAETAKHGLACIIRLSTGKIIRFEVHPIKTDLRVDATDILTETEQTELIRTITWMLDLDQDFTEFYILARQEPKLTKMVVRQAGRVLRSPTLFEDVIRTILTTNTLWNHTLRMCRELITRYGDLLPCEPELHAFPTPEQIAHVDEPTLREECRMGYRAPYVNELAQRVTSGELNLEALKTSSLSTEGLRKELLGIKGVGGYAAANLLMLLGRYDFVPVDSWALKVVSTEFFGGEKVTPKQVLSTFEKWGKWQGLVYWFWDWSPNQ
jgi:3-methyladenine DNA glycosylase/8-oxoguanine DNA glycosylase